MLTITSCSLKLLNIPVTIFCNKTALLTVSSQKNFFSAVTLESVWWAPPAKEINAFGQAVKLSWMSPRQYILNGMGYIVLHHMVRMNRPITNELVTISPTSLHCITLSPSFNLCLCVPLCTYICALILCRQLNLLFLYKCIKHMKLYFTDVL